MTTMAAIEVANGDQKIRFEGEQLSLVSSELDSRGRKSRWTEIAIYRTNDGKYVVHKVGKSRVVHRDYKCPTLRRNEDDLPTVILELLTADDYEACQRCRPQYGEVLLERDHSMAVVAEAPQGAVAACYSRDANRIWNLSWLAEDALRDAFEADQYLERAFLNFDITSLGRRGG